MTKRKDDSLDASLQPVTGEAGGGADKTPPASMPAPRLQRPTGGGRWLRRPDGSLVRQK